MKWIYIFLLSNLIISCKKETNMIVPIDKELNDDILIFENLHKSYFSNDLKFQYYYYDGDIDNMEAFKKKVKDFISSQKKEIINNKEIYYRIYDDRNLNGYKDVVYESARDNDAGSLYDFKENLLCLIMTKKEKEYVIVDFTFYNDKGHESEEIKIPLK